MRFCDRETHLTFNLRARMAVFRIPEYSRCRLCPLEPQLWDRGREAVANLRAGGWRGPCTSARRSLQWPGPGAPKEVCNSSRIARVAVGAIRQLSSRFTRNRVQLSAIVLEAGAFRTKQSVQMIDFEATKSLMSSTAQMRLRQ